MSSYSTLKLCSVHSVQTKHRTSSIRICSFVSPRGLQVLGSMNHFRPAQIPSPVRHYARTWIFLICIHCQLLDILFQSCSQYLVDRVAVVGRRSSVVGRRSSVVGSFSISRNSGFSSALLSWQPRTASYTARAARLKCHLCNQPHIQLQAYKHDFGPECTF
jgi:hypothetical protein